MTIFRSIGSAILVKVTLKGYKQENAGNVKKKSYKKLRKSKFAIIPNYLYNKAFCR